MTHLQDPAFLEDVHAAAKRYVSMLEGCIQRTKELDDQEEAATVTEQTGRQSLQVLAEQQQAWEHFLKIEKAHMGSKDVSVNVEGSTQDKISRVAAMGGTPALGAGMVELRKRQASSRPSSPPT
ncbi:hypothetical protein WJX79_004727 [Trebouxia sp. C0005]